MKIEIILVTAIILCYQNFGLANEENELPAYSQRYDADRDPFSDIAIAVQRAEENDRLVLLIVGGYWCSWCHTLDKYIKNDDEFKKSFYDTFEVVKVYYGPKNKNIQFLSKFPKITGYPHFFVLNIDFQTVGSQNTSSLEKRIINPFSAGRYNKKNMNMFLDNWTEYLKTSLNKQLQSDAEASADL